jgi:TRAP-type C4-dicarboxylate transport system permease small subunit
MRSGSDPPANDSGSRPPVPKWLVFAAGVPLLIAMAIEFFAVLARNFGWTFIGSIELVQAMILLSSSGAMVAATLSRAHAKVSIFSRRYSGRSGRFMRIILALGGTVFFAALAAGSAWIAWEMRGAMEQSELLGVPYLPLRLILTLTMTVIAVLYARRVFTELSHR